jgi:hypothetical protein
MAGVVEGEVISMTSAKPVTPPPVDEDLVDLRGFWERYSPNGELPWSSAMSLGVFTILLLLPIVLIAPFAQRDPTPPAVDVLYVGEDQNAPLGDGEEFDAEVAMGTTEPEPADELPAEVTVDEVAKIEEEELPPPEVAPADQGEEVIEQTAVAQSALDRLSQARSQLDSNLNQGAPEGGRAGGGGGTGTTGRGARVARWVLHFDTESSHHYLAQLDGLGAEIAFPAVGNRWQYFVNVGSPQRRSEIRDLGGESRLYWVDEKPQSIGGVAQVLGIPMPPFMIVFLPVRLEDRMLEMELAYKNLAEDQILRTDFHVIQRGASYDVRVTSQIPR